MGETLEEWAGGARMVALVFTDIVDSTSLGNSLGDERWIKLLQKHFDHARLLMAFSDCHEIKIIGDSFMVAFRTAVDALDFALALHEETGDERIRIRAGIHVGPVRIIENDLFGMMVNYTKRVESLAKGDWIMLSNEAKNHIDAEKASRHSKLRFRAADFKLKGFEDEQKVWRVVSPHMFRNPAAQAEPQKPRTLPPATNPSPQSSKAYNRPSILPGRETKKSEQRSDSSTKILPRFDITDGETKR